MVTSRSLIKFRLYALFFIVIIGLFSVGFPINALSQQKNLKKISGKMVMLKLKKQENHNVKFGIETKGNHNAANAIEVTEDEILFYRENGEIIARRTHKSSYMLDFSRQGKYLVLTEFLTEPEKGVKNGIYVSRLLDNKNRILWEKTGEYEYFDGREGPSSVKISDKNGTCIMFQTPWVFDMYDSTGQLIKTVKILEGKKSEIMEVHYDCVWSEDGEYFAIMSEEQGSSSGSKPATRTIKRGDTLETIHLPGYSPRSGNPWVFLFDYNGNEIWRRSIPNNSISSVGISPNGGFVIVTGYTRTIEDFETRRPFKNNTYITIKKEK